MSQNEQEFRSYLNRQFWQDPTLVEVAIDQSAKYLQKYREQCKRENDRDLRNFAEIAFPVMVEKMRPKRSFWRQVMRVDWLVALFSRLGFDNIGQCDAIQKAWREYTKELQ